MEIYLAMLAGLSGMLGWGLADFFAKKTVDKIGDFRTLLWAQIFGTIPILVFFLLNREPINLNWNIFGLLFLFAVADLSAYLLFYRGLQKGLVSILSPVFAAQSGVSVLISAFIFKEEIGSLRWIGLAIAFVGIILVSFQNQNPGKFGLKMAVKGLPEVLAGMIIFGLFFPFWDWFLGYYGQGWIAPATIQRLLVVAIFLLAILIVSFSKKTPANIAAKKGKIWIWLVLIGIFDAVAAVLTTWGYKFTDVTSVVVILSGAFPLPTVILARLFLKEKLAFNQIIGIAAIIGGLIILAL